eukprot:6371438-Amphidinium_carterae.1
MQQHCNNMPAMKNLIDVAAMTGCALRVISKTLWAGEVLAWMSHLTHKSTNAREGPDVLFARVTW